MRFFLILVLCGVYGIAGAQSTVYSKYWVYLTDKNNTPFSTNHPEEFLTQKSIDRRTRQGLTINETDLPVDPVYIDSVAKLVINITGTSRWFNAVEITEVDTAVIEQLRALSFVSAVEPVAAMSVEQADDNRAASVVYSYQLEQDYGMSLSQISQLEGDYLHELGYRGEGMTIAVMDAGFQSVNTLPAFDSLFLTGRLLGTYDFVDDDEDPYGQGTHGRNVLSIMAANMPGLYMGSAPQASYYLFRTEDGASEYRIEESNWVMAVEKSDSLGVDLVNSSLGYSSFTDSTMNYAYEDMNGRTALISRAADMASDKGMLIVTSAGNEGSGPWRYITAPGDARNILTIGAVDDAGNHASFSSYGPTADGRVKPDVCGLGRSTVYAGDNSDIYIGNGTSYSSPLVAGLVACLWQSNYEKTNWDIIDAVRATASDGTKPTDSLGFGLANFRKAHFSLTDGAKPPFQQETLPVVYPNPFETGLSVMVFAKEPGIYNLEVFSAFGQRVYAEERGIAVSRYSRFDLSTLDGLPSGMYVVQVRFNTDINQVKVIKL